LNLKLDEVDVTDPKWADYLASFAFERYYRMGSLIGTPDKCLEMVGRIKAMGFDEVACLIDFGVPVEAVLAGLPSLHALKEKSDATVGLTRERAADWLQQKLGAVVRPQQIRVVDELPRDAARAAASQPVGAIATQDIDERAQRQRAARERQQQLMRMGRGR